MVKKVLILMDMPLFPYRIYAYNELAMRGYDLTVVSVSAEERSYDILFKFKHIRLEPKRLGPFIKLKSFSFISYDDYDVIVVDPNLRMLDYYQFYRNKYWSKLVGWGHHKGRTTGNKIAEWVRFKFFRKFRSLVFYDFETAKEYVCKGFDASRIFVANNTQYVDLSTVQLKSNRNTFLYVGRIQERKKIDLAIEAFSEVVKTYPSLNLKFNIVGGGDTTYLEKIIAELGLSESVVLCGPVHDELKLAEYFNSAIAYVSPGHVGLGVLHSLAFGVPVITCKDRKHSLEIVNCKDDNSLVIDFDKESIAQAMAKLLDTNTFKSMSIQAYQYYKNYCTIDKMVDGIDYGIKNLDEVKIKEGKLLSVCNDEKIIYKNFTIYNWEHLDKRCFLPHTFIQMIMSYSRLLTRIFRLEPRAFIKVYNQNYLVAINNRIISVDLEKCISRVLVEKKEGFSTPLNFCKDENFIYWGDYGSNPNYDEVHIYQMDFDYKIRKVYTFPKGQIRHIHNIIYDKQNERFWVFTGDNEYSAGIYIANKTWSLVSPFKTGAQKYRAVVGFPSNNGLIYATDSVESDNYIYYISENGSEKVISEINGSCIYGTSIKDKYIFSTTVESHEGGGFKLLLSRKLGAGIKNKEVHLIAIDKTTFDFKIVKKTVKDFWPMKLMQYGCFMFPYGQEDNIDLWCYNMGCNKLDGKNVNLKMYIPNIIN